jgi:hypothetical protein
MRRQRRIWRLTTHSTSGARGRALLRLILRSRLVALPAVLSAAAVSRWNFVTSSANFNLRCASNAGGGVVIMMSLLPVALRWPGVLIIRCNAVRLLAICALGQPCHAPPNVASFVSAVGLGFTPFTGE